MLKRFVRNSKNGPLVDEVYLTSVCPAYARIRYPDSRESTVSLNDLSLCPSTEYNLPSPPSVNIPCYSQRVDYTRLTSPPTDNFLVLVNSLNDELLVYYICQEHFSLRIIECNDYDFMLVIDIN